MTPRMNNILMNVVNEPQVRVEYLVCVNCEQPIAHIGSVIDEIYTMREPYILMGVVIPFNSIFFTNVIFDDVSGIYWQTRIRCANC